MVKKSLPGWQYLIRVLPVSWCLCAATAILIRISLESNVMQNRIFPQVCAVCIFFALADLAFVSLQPILGLVVLLFKVFCVYFMAQAATLDALTLGCITFCLFYEVWFFLDPTPAAFASAVAVFVIYRATSVHSAWDIVRKGLDPAELAVVAFMTASASIAGRQYVKTLEKSLRQANEMRRLEETVENLTKTNTAYQTYATYIEETSKEEERHRISREIHDIVGYSMTNLLMIVQAALYSEDHDQVTELLQKAQIHINESLEEIRLALRKLRSTQKKPLHGAALIRYLTANFQNVSGIAVTLDFVSFPPKINARIEGTLYRMIQEAMTNSFRHGKATEIGISFWVSGGTLVAQIRDNGTKRPHDTFIEGIGLSGMRERVDEAGGTFSAETASDGFTIVARLPLDIPESKENAE